jgi:hypothetical protein
MWLRGSLPTIPPEEEEDWYHATVLVDRILTDDDIYNPYEGSSNDEVETETGPSDKALFISLSLVALIVLIWCIGCWWRCCCDDEPDENKGDKETPPPPASRAATSSISKRPIQGHHPTRIVTPQRDDQVEDTSSSTFHNGTTSTSLFSSSTSKSPSPFQNTTFRSVVFVSPQAYRLSGHTSDRSMMVLPPSLIPS